MHRSYFVRAVLVHYGTHTVNVLVLLLYTVGRKTRLLVARLFFVGLTTVKCCSLLINTKVLILLVTLGVTVYLWND